MGYSYLLRLTNMADLALYDEASRWFSRALRAKPRSFLNLYSRGSCRISRRDYEGALADLKLALEINPQHADCLYRLGLVYQQQQQLDPAIESFRRSMQANAAYLPPVLALMALLRMQQRWAELIEVIDQALRSTSLQREFRIQLLAWRQQAQDALAEPR
jgi:tetratricopeptide (TPR) repeat protein